MTETLALSASVAPDLTDRLGEILRPIEPGAFARLIPTLPGGRSAPPVGHVAALARRPRWDPEELLAGVGGAPGNAAGPVVVLENPRNLGNVGAVVRVAAGTGAAGVLTTGTVDPWHPQVLRGSAGLHFAVPVARVPDLGAALGRLRGGGSSRPILALDPGGRDIRDVGVPDGAVLVFGTERDGLSPATRDQADGLVALPIRPGVSSYNLATSVAMALYEWTRGAPADRTWTHR